VCRNIKLAKLFLQCVTGGAWFGLGEFCFSTALFFRDTVGEGMRLRHFAHGRLTDSCSDGAAMAKF
jgi:hypothetical protein